MDTTLVEILYFEDCPNSGVALERVREAVASAGVRAEVRMVEVRDADDAVRRRFLGSPTIHVDGRDVEPEARLRRDYGYMCRTYRSASGQGGAPPVQTIVEALREGRAGA